MASSPQLRQLPPFSCRSFAFGCFLCASLYHETLVLVDSLAVPNEIVDHSVSRRGVLKLPLAVTAAVAASALLPPSMAEASSYQIDGAPSDFLEITLDPGESLLSEPGTLIFMDDSIKMTVQSRGGGISSRLLSGGRFFVADYTNKSSKPARLALGTDFPSRIVPLNLEDHGGKLLGQLHTFLASSTNVKLDSAVEFVRGFPYIFETIEGTGPVFLTASGNIISRKLNPGEVIRVSRSALVALESGVAYETNVVQGGLANIALGGQGLFMTKLTGPGTVWLDSAPIDGLVEKVAKKATRMVD